MAIGRRWAIVAGIAMCLLATIAYFSSAAYNRSVVMAKEGVLQSELFTIRDAIDKYRQENKQQCPPSLDALEGRGYVRAIPYDPFTRSKTWRYGQAACDVKSAAPGTARDGRRYADW